MEQSSAPHLQEKEGNEDFVGGLHQKLHDLDEELFYRFSKANVPFTKERFTFVFPNTFKARRFTSLDPILVQLQILLCLLESPFQTECNTEEYYRKVYDLNNPMDIRFDLSRTSYIGDLELLMVHTLGGFCRKIAKRNIQTLFNMSKIGLLSRWNFFEHYDEWGEVTDDMRGEIFFPDMRESETLLPIRQISDFDDVGTATTEIIDARKAINMLERVYGLSEATIQLLVTDVISEICQNIPEHSKSEGYVIVHARQLDSQDVPGILDVPVAPGIEISFSDGGIGIRQSLRNRYPKIFGSASHYGAIESVLNGRVPQQIGRDRSGILRARDLVNKLDGRIEIRSICAKAVNKNPAKYDDYGSPTKPWRFFPGTQVRILIPKCQAKG